MVNTWLLVVTVQLIFNYLKSITLNKINTLILLVVEYKWHGQKKSKIKICPIWKKLKNILIYFIICPSYRQGLKRKDFSGQRRDHKSTILLHDQGVICPL